MFPVLILLHVKLQQVAVVQLLAVDGVGAVFFEPWDNVGNVEDGTVARADRVAEWL